MIRATVDVRTGWGAELAKRVNHRVAADLADASAHGAKVAASAAQARRRTGEMANIRPVAVRGTPTGWEAGFRSEAWYSGFQSRGTLGSRTRKVKASTERRRQSASGQARLAKLGASTGITPLRHEETGLREAKKRLVQLLNRIAP